MPERIHQQEELRRLSVISSETSSEKYEPVFFVVPGRNGVERSRNFGN